MAASDKTGYGLDNAWRLTFEQLAPEMTALGLDQAVLAAAIEACQDPGFSFLSQLTIAAWGQCR